MNPEAALPAASSDVSLFALFWQVHWLVKGATVGQLLASVCVPAIMIDKFLL
jgi:biopolymer transport protein TolQ